MGQQQLLLLVLAVVIVAIATTAGLNAFVDNREQAKRDAVRNGTARVVAYTQAWISAPKYMGGGQGQNDFQGISLEKIGLEPNTKAGQYETSRACFDLSANTEGHAELEVAETGCDFSERKIATVTISGQTTQDVVWTWE